MKKRKARDRAADQALVRAKDRDRDKVRGKDKARGAKPNLEDRGEARAASFPVMGTVGGYIAAAIGLPGVNVCRKNAKKFSAP